MKSVDGDSTPKTTLSPSSRSDSKPRSRKNRHRSLPEDSSRARIKRNLVVLKRVRSVTLSSLESSPLTLALESSQSFTTYDEDQTSVVVPETDCQRAWQRETTAIQARFVQWSVDRRREKGAAGPQKSAHPTIRSFGSGAVQNSSAHVAPDFQASHFEGNAIYLNGHWSSWNSSGWRATRESFQVLIEDRIGWLDFVLFLVAVNFVLILFPFSPEEKASPSLRRHFKSHSHRESIVRRAFCALNRMHLMYMFWQEWAGLCR